VRSKQSPRSPAVNVGLNPTAKRSTRHSPTVAYNRVLRSSMPVPPNTAAAVSVIIPWCNRPELSISLSENMPSFRRAHAEVIVVNCGGDLKILRHLLRTFWIQGMRLVNVSHRRFNKSLALNAGFLVSQGSIVQFLDADIILGRSYFNEALTQLPRKAYVTLARVQERGSKPRAQLRSGISELAHSITIVRRDRSAQVETNRVRYGDCSRSAPGIVMFRRESFLCVDGMNSDLQGWGFEDIDFLVRLQLATGRPPAQAGCGYHISHDDRHRTFTGKTPQHSESSNSARCLYNYQHGHFMGTYQDDIKTLHKLMRTENGV